MFKIHGNFIFVVVVYFLKVKEGHIKLLIVSSVLTHLLIVLQFLAEPDKTWFGCVALVRKNQISTS